MSKGPAMNNARGKAPLRRLAGVMFDLDGTLADSFTDITTAMNLTRADFGMPPLPLAQVRGTVGGGSKHLVKTLVPVPDAEFERAFAVYQAHYEAHLLDHTRLYPGVMETLRHFSGRPLAVVTNKHHRFAEKVLKGLGIRDYFQMVLGGDSLARRKPDPLPVVTVLERFRLAAVDTALVGDGLHDIEAARAAGVIAVAVATGVESRESLGAASPFCLLESLEELPGLFA